MKKLLFIFLVISQMQKANFIGVALIHPTDGVTYHALPEKWYKKAKNYCNKHYPALPEKPEINIA